VSELRTEVERLRRVEDAVLRIETELPHLATKEAIAEIRTEIAGVRTAIGEVEIRLIKWMLGTGIAAVVVVSAQLWGAAQLLLRLHQ
jgi:hypothetical protein